MSDRLAKQMAVLRRQRAELERSVQRIGEAFAHGLDREAPLDIVAETALAACEGESCRIVRTDRGSGRGGPHRRRDRGEALRAAESAALQEGGEAEATRKDVHALARGMTGIHDNDRRLGAMTIVRQGDPFDAGQRELFRYLAGQAAVSVENLDQVNDTYGHLQGDEVLRTIGRILLEESRAVDEPARYGGEEFVVALPETGPGRGVEGGGANPSPHRGGGDPARRRVRGDPRHGQPGGRGRGGSRRRDRRRSGEHRGLRRYECALCGNNCPCMGGLSQRDFATL